MTNIIEWQEEWGLGIKTIDKQHKILILLLNDITKSSITNASLLIKLIEYVTNHFSEEERIMIESRYNKEEYLYHKEEHNKFIRVLLEFSFSVIENKEEQQHVVKELKNICFTWFKYHFLETDKRLADFLHNGGDAHNL